MARVNVESQALTDARFSVLASLMGLEDPDFAMGKVIRVWIQCVERETYVLTPIVINSIFGNRRWFPKETDSVTLPSGCDIQRGFDGVELLLMSELAERSPDDYGAGIRIKGTRGRIEYLAIKRATARRNGLLGGRPALTKAEPTLVSVNIPPATNAASTPAPAPAPALLKTDPIPPKAIEDTPKPKRVVFIPPQLAEVEEYCRQENKPIDAEHFWNHYNANGWVQSNGRPIKSWKSAIVTWVKNQKRFSGTQGAGRPVPPPRMFAQD